MIKIVDYGLGNIFAFLNVYKRLNIPAAAAHNADELAETTHLILPGVGSFDHAMEMLQQSGMRETLDDLVLKKNIPILGVCIGMQIMAKHSEEGTMPGLGWVQASVRKLHNVDGNLPLRLPHMGWNNITQVAPSNLFAGLKRDARFYFLHSYYFDCESSNTAITKTDYGMSFVSTIHSNNIYAVQFHPEKSHQYGAQLLKNFSEL